MKMIRDNRKSLYLVCAEVLVILAAMITINVVLDRKMDIDSNAMLDSTVYQYHIAMISSDPYDEFWMSVYEGANETGKEKAVYVENFGENLDMDYPVEDLMKMAIAAKVDGIIVEADKTEQMKGLIDDATQEGIPVMTVLSDAPGSSRISFVSGYNYALGEMYGSQILEEAKQRIEDMEKGEKVSITVLLNSSDKNSTQNLIYSGMRETTTAIENQIKLTAFSIDASGEFKSEETVRNLILSSERPDILVCLSAADTISAYQCVVDYNMVGKVSIIGYYCSDDILKEIKKGIVKSTISINAQEMGRIAVEGMYEYLTKEYVSEYLPVTSELITADNVDEYLNEEGL